MKKLKLMLLLPLLLLTGCDEPGNRQRGIELCDTFEHAHLVSIDKCVDIQSYYFNDTRVDIYLTNGEVLKGHSSEIILLKNKSNCPYCTGRK